MRRMASRASEAARTRSMSWPLMRVDFARAEHQRLPAGLGAAAKLGDHLPVHPELLRVAPAEHLEALGVVAEPLVPRGPVRGAPSRSRRELRNSGGRSWSCGGG